MYQEDDKYSNREENRIPLSETPYYKMIGYMMRLPKRFFYMQREYYSGKVKDSELLDITTKPFWESIRVNKRRLDCRGLRMDVEITEAVRDSSYGSDVYRMQSKENERDEYGIKTKLMRVKRRFYKGEKCIYKSKTQELSMVSIMKSKVNGEITYCPACGYQGSISGFIDGCDACGSHFTVNDFEPKIAGVSLEENARMKLDNFANQLMVIAMLTAVIAFPVILIVYYAFSLLELFISNGFWSNVVSGIIQFVGQITLCAYPVFLCMMFGGLILWYAVNASKKYDMAIKEEHKVINLFSNFSVPDFYQNLEYKLRNIHLVENSQSMSLIAKCTMDKFLNQYKDVVYCDITSLQFGEAKEKDECYYVNCDTTMRLFCYSHNRIRTEYEDIQLLLSGKKNVVDKPITAMRMHCCPGCGRSLNLLEEVTCQYCGKRYNLEEYDWMIEKYKGKRRKDIGPIIITLFLGAIFLFSTAFLYYNG